MGEIQLNGVKIIRYSLGYKIGVVMPAWPVPHHRMKTSLLLWKYPPGHYLTHPPLQYVGTGGRERRYYIK